MWKRPEREQAIKALNDIFDILGKQCSRCGFSDTRALQIDHNEGSCKTEKSVSNKRHYYRRILRELSEGSSRYSILCANCNWIKRFEDNRNPPRLV